MKGRGRGRGRSLACDGLGDAEDCAAGGPDVDALMVHGGSAGAGATTRPTFGNVGARTELQNWAACAHAREAKRKRNSDRLQANREGVVIEAAAHLRRCPALGRKVSLQQMRGGEWSIVVRGDAHRTFTPHTLMDLAFSPLARISDVDRSFTCDRNAVKRGRTLVCWIHDELQRRALENMLSSMAVLTADLASAVDSAAHIATFSCILLRFDETEQKLFLNISSKLKNNQQDSAPAISSCKLQWSSREYHAHLYTQAALSYTFVVPKTDNL